jgi:hypothetical protein
MNDPLVQVFSCAPKRRNPAKGGNVAFPWPQLGAQPPICSKIVKIGM